MKHLSPAALLAALLAAALVALAPPLQAQTLTMGMQGDPTSLDPQFFNSTANDSLARDIYDKLMDTDDKGNVVGALAASWRQLDPLTWEFKLHPGIVFSDGTPLTAADIVFSMARACCIPNSPYSLGTYTRGKTFTAIDTLTLRITSAAPVPTMLDEMARIAILSARSGDHTTADYNTLHGSPGTGAYKLVERIPGDRIVLEPNPLWRGGKPRWQRVVIRPIQQDGPRLAGLLTGELDIIDAVPPPDAARLRASPDTRTDQAPANRMVHLRMDEIRERTPDITGNDGEPIDNPLRKLAVRQALMQAINRPALVDRVMDGLAVAATQFALPGQPDFNPDITLPPYDPVAAKARLAEAGYPNGFKMLLHSPNDRLVNDKRTAEAVAQMFTRIGIRTDVDAQPSSMFFPRTSRNEYSIYLTSWGLYDMVNTVRANLHTPSTTGGYGVSNATNYSNPAIDKLTEEAIVTTDPTARRKLLIQATKLGIDDVALIPLYNAINVWGLRRTLSYKARSDGTTVAEDVTPNP